MSLVLQPTDFTGVFVVDNDPIRDDRGYFVRTFCTTELAARGLESRFVQHSMSYTARKGTLRGLHFQRPPHDEIKLVRCLRGAIYDVIVDLRPQSPSFKRWLSFDLSHANRSQLYVPKGFAHGFQALTDDVEVNYMISAEYEPAAAGGVRYDDAAFGIAWPLSVTAISDKDRGWPDFR